MLAEGARGVTYPATLSLSIAIGVWLTFTRASFGSSGAMANSDHLIDRGVQQDPAAPPGAWGSLESLLGGVVGDCTGSAAPAQACSASVRRCSAVCRS